MQKHTKIYLEAFGFEQTDFIPSEISGKKANDIHHIDCKGMGGDPSGSKDRIEELIAVTREEHEQYGDKKDEMYFLYTVHLTRMELKGVKFDRHYMNDKIDKHRPKW